MVQMTKHDLQFILKQIKIAEAHSAGTELTEIRVDADGNVVETGGTLAIADPLAPFGLRTVDGSYNNIAAGREEWGAADNPFLHLTDPYWRDGYGTTGNVVDADPRTISNLIVDQTLGNPAAIATAIAHAGFEGAALTTALNSIIGARDALAAANALADDDPTKPAAVAQATTDLADALTAGGVEMDGPTIVIPNVAPDEGLSAPFNSWFTLFGQFFDHGLDLVAKAGASVLVPLQPDDPLYSTEPGAFNFMVLTRSLPDAPNLTTPFVDQNQTYSSHASKQLFMREYELVGDPAVPVATGRLLDGANGGMPTWAEVKAQAATLLGIELTDADIGNIPLFAMDPYGEFIRGDNGLPQMVIGLGPDGVPGGGDDVLVEGNLTDPINPADFAGTVRTGHAFLDDIAHNAAPVLIGGVLAPDADAETGNAVATGPFGNRLEYDNELLDRHFITGDGRGNENIGLTTVHHVFHSEHNHMVDQVKEIALAEGATDIAFLNEWLLVDVAEIPADLSTLQWDGERLFQAARVPTEMQYQHLVFEEFARKIQPDVDAFVFNPSSDIDPAIFAEFAHVVYRFGHSMLAEQVDRINADGTRADVDLMDAFLNPVMFDESGGAGGLDASVAAGAIARGMTGQVGMEIDEFVADVLRNNLLGIPLDLATLNLARGRETGMPSLNEARRQFQEIAQGDSQLEAYTSWTDFAANLKNPLSIVNFVAAYGTHSTITGAATVADKRDAAMLLVFGGEGAPEDRLDFLSGTGAYATGLGGLEDVDLWVGGLAEKKMAFGGMLGSTFSFVFELQLENLQNGDRFYYLSRMQGLNLLNELEGNSLAKMVLHNTDLGETGYALPGDIFSVPDHTIYVDAAKMTTFGLADPTHNNPFVVVPMVQRVDANNDGIAEYIRVNSNDHFLIQGTDQNDTIMSGGGDDSVWGGAGNDRIEAGYGVDKIHGGTGDDIITNSGTDIGEVDFFHGEEGNDVIHGGSGLALLFGNQGQDFLMTGPDGKEAFGGTGNDFILGGEGGDFLLGNEGDDWLEGGNGFDVIAGDNSELFFNSTIIGHDVMFAGQNEQDFDAESGDDIMAQGASVMRNEGMFGYDWAIHKFNTEAANSDMKINIFATDVNDILRDRFDQTEALSGWHFDDILRGDDRSNLVDGDGEAPAVELSLVNNVLTQAGVDRIAGLRELFGDWVAPATQDGNLEDELAFDSGNILLGGGGSDLIEGRGANDLIDGDAWLNVRIRIDVGGQIYTAESMTSQVFLESDVVEGVVRPGAFAAFNGRLLNGMMLDRTLNPGQLSIVREIVQDDGVGDIDVAEYWDEVGNYTFTQNADGSLTVTHVTFDPATAPQNTLSDGTDRLLNMEALSFSDGAGGRFIVNLVASGSVGISDMTPTEGTAITALTDTIDDPNGVLSTSFQWQSLVAGVWTDILDATGESFVPTDTQVNTPIRVIVEYTDFFNLTKSITSGATTVVGDLEPGGGGAAVSLVGTEGQDDLTGGYGLDTIQGLGGDDRLVGHMQVDTLIGGHGNDFVDGGVGGSDRAVFSGALRNYGFVLNGSNQLTLTDKVGLDGTDTLVNVEVLEFQDLTKVVRTGTVGNDSLISTTFAHDLLLGFDGDDTLSGGTGFDYMVGGTGNDTIDGGASGQDFAMYSGAISDYSYGIDLAGNVVITDNVGTDGTDTVRNVEALVFNTTGAALVAGGNGADTLIRTVFGNDLILGFGGDDTIDGFNGHDYIIGGEGNDTVHGGVGNDTLVWNAGDGRDFLDGGVMTDHVVINGDAGPEVFGIYTRVVAEGLGYTLNNANTEIVITRNGVVITELDNIEEINVDGKGGGDTFDVQGDFTGTSLAYSTITLEGSSAQDMVDITGLASDHRIVFNANGGGDSVVGSLRPQDVVNGDFVSIADGQLIDLSGITDVDETDVTGQLPQVSGPQPVVDSLAAILPEIANVWGQGSEDIDALIHQGPDSHTLRYNDLEQLADWQFF